MLAYRMMMGPDAGHLTTDVEQYIRWLSSVTVVTPEHAQKLREVARQAAAYAEAERGIDAKIDAAAAKFEDRD